MEELVVLLVGSHMLVIAHDNKINKKGSDWGNDKTTMSEWDFFVFIIHYIT